ncbi:hypothetical protein LCGC14_2733010 [marine sediment metagenome]|uniref:Gfo/Idh/MocA-like oxidoreductase N-terminal domain-containing protein n=1 Tax=marine sediment metagenome TaxID=412755 RepID=A0A0F8ZU20_9ZZZZ
MSRLSVGVIGCGAIAQIQHLPHLRELNEQFEVGAICDISRELLRRVGDEYDVPGDRRFRDYRELVKADIDAVIVCPSGTHAPHAIVAAAAGGRPPAASPR